MSVKSYNSCILLYTFFVIAASVDLGYASPTTTVVKDDPIIESLEEINDLNKNIILRDSTSMETAEPMYTHRDQDTIDSERLTTILGKLKNDVEILESNEPGKTEDGSEIEERYRGPSIVINTDEFINENIEMNAEDEAEERADKEALATSHLILSIILVVVALLSIGLYAALVMWRSHIEQRYGMRELLVTSDNQDYWPQHMTDPAIPSHFQAQQQLQQQQQNA